MELACRCSSQGVVGGGSSPAAGAFAPSVADPTADPATREQRLIELLQRLNTIVQQLIVAVQQLGPPGQLPGAILRPDAGAQATAGAGALGAPVAASDAATPDAGTAPVTQQTPPAGPSTIRVATFNTLGASHTAGGEQHPKWKSGATRTAGMIDALTSGQVDVAGLQEFQKSQRAAFKDANTGFDIFTKGNNSIVWKADRFQLVSSSSVKLPYFEGKEVERPIVQLEERTTGKRAWFVSIHNPADVRSHQNQGKHRTEALRRERELLEQLRQTGLPVFLVGDFNNEERARETITEGGLAVASDPPGGATQIDWIFGSGPMRFTDHQVDASVTKAKISDHPLVVATAEI